MGNPQEESAVRTCVFVSPGTTGPMGPSLEGALRLSLRSLRQPLSGLAAILAAGARDLALRLVAVYLVPFGPAPVELLASAGMDAAALGPPGPLEEDTGMPFRTLAAHAAPRTISSPFPHDHPWTRSAHLVRSSALLTGARTALLMAGGETAIEPDAFGRLATASVAFGSMAAADQEVARLRADLHRLKQERALLAAGLQHDLRGPLTSILGAARTLERAPAGLAPEHERELMDIITNQAERLNAMVTASLGAELPSAEDPVRHRLTDIGEVVRRSAEAARLGRGGTIVLNVPSMLLVTDERRLERALLNLLDNALKYSPADKAVHVTASVTEVGVMLVVADGGPGVAPEVLPTLYRPYSSDPARSDGTGLGLHSVSQLAEEMGGSVSYARQGGWTRFSLIVPDLRRASSSGSPDPDAAVGSARAASR